MGKAETDNFLKAEKMAEELADKLELLYSEASSYQTATEEIKEARLSLTAFLKEIEVLSKEVVTLVKTSNQKGLGGIQEGVKDIQEKVDSFQRGLTLIEKKYFERIDTLQASFNSRLQNLEDTGNKTKEKLEEMRIGLEKESGRRVAYLDQFKEEVNGRIGLLFEDLKQREQELNKSVSKANLLLVVAIILSIIGVVLPFFK